MYIFDKVVATIVPTGIVNTPVRYEFDFYLSSHTMSFSDAKKVADPAFLEDRVAQLRNSYREQNAGEQIELTSATSKIRGYQGGLCHIALLGIDYTPHLVLLRRGADAPTSPLMLDIAAGRMEFSDESWQETILREGLTEIGYYTSEEKLCHCCDHIGSRMFHRLDKFMKDAYERTALFPDVPYHNREGARVAGLQKLLQF
ncbi:hypothetical protein HZC31_00225 [Candidatus Woesearchaeota archaeon]|nr:hypothetical protein [Candidatus Woesearchaeota archaeon]